MPPVRMLDAPATRQLLAANNVVLIDVREAGEYAREHIAGARLIPLSQLDAAHVSQFARDKPIVVCCASGNRSQTAVRRLTQAGIGDLAHLDGGLTAWKAAGFPIEEDRSAPIPILRQVQLIAGSLAVVGTALGVLLSPWFLLIPAAVGAGLMHAGASGSCLMTGMLSKLPYNQPNKSVSASERLA